MRVFFAMSAQFSYSGLVQQSIMLIKYLREFGCEVLPMVALAPPHNDEMPLEQLGARTDVFNLSDYVLDSYSPALRHLLGWYGRRYVKNTDPQELKKGTHRSIFNPDPLKIATRMLTNPLKSDLQKIEQMRREFQPDIDYTCELSMSNYFGMIEDHGLPLVSAAQGYEVCQRLGIDVVNSIRKYGSRIDCLISASEANKRENIAYDFPELLPKVRVIPYGIMNDGAYDMSMAEALCRSERIAQSRNDFVITTLSRVDIEKGQDLALHALRILLNEGHRVRLRIIGDSVVGDSYRSVIEAKIRMMDLQDHVDLIGFVREKADKVALLKTSNALLATFVRSEPFGLVMCEAMGAGIPVVAPDNGAGSEILGWSAQNDDHPSGLIYRAHDTGQMADRLRYLIEHPLQSQAIGAAGARAVSRYFNARRMAWDLYQLFQELVANNPRKMQPWHMKVAA